ncbi:MAG: CHAT domain-containing protein [Planctomycetota bacterium]
MFEKAAPILSSVGPANVSVTLTWRCSQAWTLVLKGRLDEARSILEEACAELARVRATAEGLDAFERARLTQQARHQDPHHLLASVEARSKNGEAAFRAIESGRSRELLALFDATRRSESTGPAERSSGVPLSEVASLQEVQAALGPREKMLIYSVGNADSVAILIGREQLVHWLPSMKGGRIPEHRWASLVEGYLDFVRLPPDAIAPRGGGDAIVGQGTAQSPARRGFELFRALMPEEIWAQLREVDVLYVCPHGPLTSLPFEALIVAPGSDWPNAVYWLDVGPQIAYLPSASFLPRMVAPEPARADRRRFVVLGDPVSAEAALPGARLEIERIEKVVSRDERAVVESLTGSEATRARLFEAAEGAEILHLATHGRVARRGDTIEASLLLASEPDSKVPGTLTLSDLLGDWRGRLSQSRLTMLSACETARGERVRDEGQLALPLGFQIAGCPRVVASYWPVADALATPDLMEHLYEGLMESDSTVLSSLVLAKRSLRKARPHPFYWATFALFGVR